MAARQASTADLVAARRDVERLEARVAELTRLIAGRSEQDGPVRPLSLQQTMVVAAIARTGRFSRVDMNTYLRRSGYDVVNVRHQIHFARLRLAPHGIEIATLQSWGWEMDAASRARWAALASRPQISDVARSA